MAAHSRRSGAWRRAAVVALATIVAGACTGDGDDTADGTTSSTIPPAQTLLRVGVEDWPDCLNPVTCGSPVLRQQILQHVLPVAFEVTDDNGYRPSPVLAGQPDVAVGDDGMRITYRLDEDARWNDGRPITSSDLRATWQAVMATPGADRTGYELITEIDDRDPLEAVVSLSEPYAEWRQLFGGGRNWILKGDELGTQLDLTDRFRDELPFSAAPYRLAAWDDDGAVLAAVEDHWAAGAAPDIDQVRLARVDLDDLDSPQAYDILVPAGGVATGPIDGFEVRRLPTTTVVGIWFDQRTPLLAEQLHRQVVATILDRQAAAEEVSELAGDEPLVCLGWLPDVGPWCDAARVELPETDVDVAAFALATAGWVPGPGGDLLRGEAPFVVPLTHDPAVPGTTAVADAVAEALAAVGIRTDRLPMATRTWAERRSPELSTGIGIFPVDLGVSPQVPGYACPDGLPSSRMWWCPPEVVASARALMQTLDEGRQLELVESIGSAAAADVAWLPLAQQGAASYVRAEGLSVPDEVSVTGGPLGGLPRFELDD